MKNSVLHNKGGKLSAPSWLSINMYFVTFFFPSRIGYTHFYHTLDGNLYTFGRAAMKNYIEKNSFRPSVTGYWIESGICFARLLTDEKVSDLVCEKIWESLKC